MRILGFALLATLPLGCDRLLGIEELPGPAAVVDAGVDATDDARVESACSTCALDRCAAPARACSGDAGCRALVDCVGGCSGGDVACRARCEQMSGAIARQANYLALDGCRREHCVGDCYGASGLVTALSAGCACAEGTCAEETLRCLQSGLPRDEAGVPAQIGACERRVACLAGRVNPDIFVECNQGTDGLDEFKALRSCLKTAACKTGERECPFALGDLSCLNAYKFSTTAKPEVNVGLRVSWVSLDTPSSYRVLEGARVTPCFGACDASCKPGPYTATTVAGGEVVISLPMAFGQFTGCFKVEAPAALGLPELRVYPGRVLHQDENLMWTIIPEAVLLDYYGARFASTDWATHAHVLGTLHDCMWLRTLNAQIEVTPKGKDDENVVIYLQGGVPDDTARGTTSSGNFAVLNMPAGPHTILAKKDGVTMATMDVVSIPGTLMDANLYPQAVK